MPKSLIHEVAEYCWSNNFIVIFRRYFEKNAALFVNAPDMCEGEHNLIYYNCFEKYLQLYEDTLTDYLQKLNVSIEEFYAEVRETKEDTTDPYILTFIECLLASTDYESFYKVMVREGKKIKIAAVPVSIQNEIMIEDKSESKDYTTSYSKSIESKRSDYKHSDFK